MTVEMRVRIFLTKYRELVKELGLAITHVEGEEFPLALRWNEEVRATHADEETPSFIPFVGDYPNFPYEMHAYLMDKNDRMYVVEPYSDMPTYDTGYKKMSQDELNEKLKALGLIQ